MVHAPGPQVTPVWQALVPVQLIEHVGDVQVTPPWHAPSAVHFTVQLPAEPQLTPPSAWPVTSISQAPFGGQRAIVHAAPQAITHTLAWQLPFTLPHAVGSHGTTIEASLPPAVAASDPLPA